jgi:hypothetical protein
MMKLAETVVIRGKPEYRFDVDGQDFPWWISERGARVTQLLDDLFEINVEILCIPKAYDGDERGHENCRVGQGDLTVRLEGYMGRRLFIGDVEFPWDITADGVVIKTGVTLVPSVSLSFFAKDVDSNRFIDDARHILDIDGAVYAVPENSKGWHKPQEHNVNKDGSYTVSKGDDIGDEISLRTEEYCREISAASCEEVS